jgi:uncharacterized protein YqgQ
LQDSQRLLRRYGSDRDTGGTVAQAERDFQDSQRLLRRYGSDRDTGGTVAQAERDFQDSQRLLRRYGSDRNGSDRMVINDPDYAQFKLKKMFEENWTSDAR